MVEEIITALSRMRWLFVIARNSSFTYKGRAVDVKQVGRELGVRYVLEGSVRKSGNRVRITGQLIDTSTGAHLWADRFDGALEDIFDLQDQVTASVVGAISPKLEQAEIERARRKPTENLDAYDYLPARLGGFNQWTNQAMTRRCRYSNRPSNSTPHFAVGLWHGRALLRSTQRNGWMTDRAGEIAETARLVRMASQWGKDDAVALNTAGTALAYVVGDLSHGSALIDQSLLLNSNLAAAWHQSGWMRIISAIRKQRSNAFPALCDLARETPTSLTCRRAPDAHIFSPVVTPRLCHGPKRQRGSSRTRALQRVPWPQPVPWRVGRSRHKRR